MNYLKCFLLNTLLVGSSFIYCMDQNKEENKNKITINTVTKQRIVIDYTNVNWGEYFEKLPNEIINKILDYFFDESDLDELERFKCTKELLKIYGIKSINKAFFIFLSQNYSNQLKKISEILGRQIFHILSYSSYLPEKDSDLVIKIIRSGAQLNLKDERCGDTPLIQASFRGRKPIIIELIKAGADLNAQSTADNQSALMLSVQKNYLEITKLLIDAGVNLDLKDHKGQTAIIKATELGCDLDGILELIKAKANLNMQDKDANTVLIWAAHHGSKELVLKLIKSGANVNLKNSLGLTALDIAKTQEIKDIILNAQNKNK